MAYVITAVGAGGKTSYLKRRAEEYRRQGKRVAVTTTTHIWPPDPKPFSYSISEGTKRKTLAGRTESFISKNVDIVYFGIPERDGKLKSPGEEAYRRICREYDVVLVEGDGSHCMPMKIPSGHEPVIPDNTDEIVVIMGAHAVGRRLDVVCQRYEGTSREKVSEQLLQQMAEAYYVHPLQAKYPGAKISYELSKIPLSRDRMFSVLMASGFGRRYGGNKLLDLYQRKPLYLHALDHITEAAGNGNTIVVTQYEEIRKQALQRNIKVVWNDQAEEGIAASIRLGTQTAIDLGGDAVMFFAADMPRLPAEEIRLYTEQFLGSGKPYGCMEFGKEHISTNPGAFRLETGAEMLLNLTGDLGAMRIMKKEPWNIYYYQIAPEYVEDIDIRKTRQYL